MGDDNRNELMSTENEEGRRGVTAPSAEKPPEPEWLFYVISFFVQLAGIVIGAIYLGKPSEECRRFGKNCLIAAFIPFIIYCLCISLYVLFFFAYFIFYIFFIIVMVIFAGFGGAEFSLIGALFGL